MVAKLESEWAQKTFSGSKKNAALHDSKMALLDRLQFPSNELLKALGKDRASRPNGLVHEAPPHGHAVLLEGGFGRVDLDRTLIMIVLLFCV